MNKTKYDYDIDIITKYYNKGFSIREISRRMGWDNIGTQNWVRRNFKRETKFIPIKEWERE